MGTRGDYIHATPETDDASRTLQAGDMEMSHGCIHTLAADRNALIEEGFLRGGVKITVRPYDPAKMPWGKPAPEAP